MAKALQITFKEFRERFATLDGIRQIQGQEYVLFRKCLLHMLLGKAGRDYTNRHNMGLRAKLYFKLMLLDMMRGKYDRPVQTYLIGS